MHKPQVYIFIANALKFQGSFRATLAVYLIRCVVWIATNWLLRGAGVTAPFLAGGVARAFPGGRGKMRKKMWKIWGKLRKTYQNFRKEWRKCEAGYDPVLGLYSFVSLPRKQKEYKSRCTLWILADPKKQKDYKPRKVQCMDTYISLFRFYDENVAYF